MKVVREHINERFEEESDPVHDMGIGISQMIEDYKKKKDFSSRSRTLTDGELVGSLVEDMVTVGWRYKGKPLSDEDYHQRVMMIEYLLKKGANVNDPGNYILSNIMNIRNSNARRIEVLNLILKYGFKIKTLEHLFEYDADANADEVEVLKILIKAGIIQRKPKFAQIFKNNVLTWAAKGHRPGYIELIKFALEEGAEPSYKKYYVLQQALEHDNIELVKMFMKFLQNDPKYK